MGLITWLPTLTLSKGGKDVALNATRECLYQRLVISRDWLDRSICCSCGLVEIQVNPMTHEVRAWS